MLKALNGEYKDKLNELFDTIDVKILGTFYYGTRQLTVNKEVHTLDDLKGMKIRVPQADLYVKMIESWNAAATPMALNELYLALQTGTVDGQENPLTTYEAQKFYETNAKYIILTNHIICPNMMFMNGDVWNSLSEHDQEVVSTAIANAIEWQGQQQLEAEAKLADELTAKGCTVITPDETIKEATVPYIQPAIEDWDLLQTYAD
jgi:TRAP-type C4-dicarboxylate transport system substrate-binding protein